MTTERNDGGTGESPSLRHAQTRVPRPHSTLELTVEEHVRLELALEDQWEHEKRRLDTMLWLNPGLSQESLDGIATRMEFTRALHRRLVAGGACLHEEME